jgi:hypothetical protein
LVQLLQGWNNLGEDRAQGSGESSIGVPFLVDVDGCITGGMPRFLKEEGKNKYNRVKRGQRTMTITM